MTKGVQITEGLLRCEFKIRLELAGGGGGGGGLCVIAQPVYLLSNWVSML